MNADELNKTIREPAANYVVAQSPWPEEPLIIERGGRPAAVIISLEEYRRYAAWRAERNARRAWVLARDPRQQMSEEEWRSQYRALDRFAEHFADVSDEELAAELTEAIQAVRSKKTA